MRRRRRMMRVRMRMRMMRMRRKRRKIMMRRMQLYEGSLRTFGSARVGAEAY